MAFLIIAFKADNYLSYVKLHNLIKLTFHKTLKRWIYFLLTKMEPSDKLQPDFWIIILKSFRLKKNWSWTSSLSSYSYTSSVLFNINPNPKWPINSFMASYSVRIINIPTLFIQKRMIGQLVFGCQWMSRICFSC